MILLMGGTERNYSELSGIIPNTRDTYGIHLFLSFVYPEVVLD